MLNKIYFEKKDKLHLKHLQSLTYYHFLLQVGYPASNSIQQNTMTKTPISILVFTLIFLLIGPSSTMALCIKNEKANLRKGPGTKYEKL